MVPAPSRRRLLAAAGTLTATLGAGGALATATAQQDGGADAAGWPMVQHDPAGQSYAPSASPPRDDVTVRWRQSLDADRGFVTRTTPIVADGWVYLAGRDLLVLDTVDGSVRYRNDPSVDGPIAIAPARAYTSPTLAIVDADRVTGRHASGGLDLFGARVARTRWEASADGDTDRFFAGSGLERSPPVVADGTVVAPLAGRLAAVDASSGRVRWETTVETRRPAVRDGTVYVADFPASVLGYDLATGEQVFEATLNDTQPLGVTAGPERLVVATSTGLAGISYEGSIEWRFEPEGLSRDRGAVALAEGVAYAGFRGEDDTRLVAVDVGDGTGLWRSPAAPEQEPQFAPPAVADGVVYVPLEDSGIAGVDAADGHVRWRFDPGERARPWSPVALAGETLYAIGNGQVYALEEA